MSDTSIVQPTRVFMMGTTRLLDIDPSATPKKVLELYTPNYPHLAHCTISEPELKGEELVYTIEKPPAKTKG